MTTSPFFIFEREILYVPHKHLIQNNSQGVYVFFDPLFIVEVHSLLCRRLGPSFPHGLAPCYHLRLLQLTDQLLQGDRPFGAPACRRRWKVSILWLTSSSSIKSSSGSRSSERCAFCSGQAQIGEGHHPTVRISATTSSIAQPLLSEIFNVDG
jgi:hypothetical protein